MQLPSHGFSSFRASWRQLSRLVGLRLEPAATASFNPKRPPGGLRCAGLRRAATCPGEDCGKPRGTAETRSFPKEGVRCLWAACEAAMTPRKGSFYGIKEAASRYAASARYLNPPSSPGRIKNSSLQPGLQRGWRTMGSLWLGR